MPSVKNLVMAAGKELLLKLSGLGTCCWTAILVHLFRVLAQVDACAKGSSTRCQTLVHAPVQDWKDKIWFGSVGHSMTPPAAMSASAATFAPSCCIKSCGQDFALTNFSDHFQVFHHLGSATLILLPLIGMLHSPYMFQFKARVPGQPLFCIMTFSELIWLSHFQRILEDLDFICIRDKMHLKMLRVHAVAVTAPCAGKAGPDSHAAVTHRHAPGANMQILCFALDQSKTHAAEWMKAPQTVMLHMLIKNVRVAVQLLCHLWGYPNKLTPSVQMFALW